MRPNEEFTAVTRELGIIAGITGAFAARSQLGELGFTLVCENSLLRVSNS